MFPSVDCCLSYCEANAADGRKPRQRVSREQQHAHSHVNHLSAASYPACPSDGRRVTMRAASMHNGGACAREACVRARDAVTIVVRTAAGPATWPRQWQKAGCRNTRPRHPSAVPRVSAASTGRRRGACVTRRRCGNLCTSAAWRCSCFWRASIHIRPVRRTPSPSLPAVVPMLPARRLPEALPPAEQDGALRSAPSCLAGSVQARHSYYVHADEIKFDHDFAPCVRTDKNGCATVDMRNFHRLRPRAHERVARSVVAHA